MITPQLPLNLQLPSYATFANFCTTAANHQLVAHLKSVSQGTGEFLIYCWGEQGVGKTHLLQASCHAATQHGLTAMYLDLADSQCWCPQLLQGFEQINLVCLDNIHVLAGQSAWEMALFNLYNSLQAHQQHLVVSANVAPVHLILTLPDLMSRLAAGLSFQIGKLNDAEKQQVLQQLAQRRGLRLDAHVAAYMLHRYARDMKTLSLLLDKLDHVSLSVQRRLTIPLVKQVLDDLVVSREA